MEAGVVLLVLWVLVIPIGCLIAASRAMRRSERVENEVLGLHRVVAALRAEISQLGRSSGAEPTTGGGKPTVAAVPTAAADPTRETVTPPEAVAPSGLGTRPRTGVGLSPVPVSTEVDGIEASEPGPVPVADEVVPETVTPATRPALVIPPMPVAPPKGRNVAPVRPKVDWERFMGVKLFAWVGGFALFLAVAFFVKYSFDNNLIPPEVRVAIGFVAGLALVVGGTVLKRKAYAATAQTLCATGIVILYAVSFACHARYGFTGYNLTFGMMVVVTVTAFVLAARMPAQVVAVLGLVGGFLTPPLLGGQVDRPLGLFGYVAILDAGLVAVALVRRWHYLVGLAVVGTAAIELGWAVQFFEPAKVFTALIVFAVFNVLFFGAWWAGDRRGQPSRWLDVSALALPLLTFLFAFRVLGDVNLGVRPGVVFLFLLAADLPVLAIALRHPPLRAVQMAAGSLAFTALATWIASWVNAGMLVWALGGALGFAVLHTVFPIVAQRLRPGGTPLWFGHLFPVLALVLVLVPIMKDLSVPWLLWPVVMLIDVLAIVLALSSGALLGVLAVLVLTLAAAGFWIAQVPLGLESVWPALGVVGGFALFFFVVSTVAGERILGRIAAAAGGVALASRPVLAGEDAGAPGRSGFPGKADETRLDLPAWLHLPGPVEVQRAELPALSAILPFLLLILIATRLPIADPSPVYGLALVLIGLLLGLAKQLRLGVLGPVGLACVLALELSWHEARFSADHAWIPLVWNVGFAGVFMAYPFVFRRDFTAPVLPWATAALAGPLHFYLVYRVVKAGYPNALMGLLPAAFAVPMLLALAFVARSWAAEAPNRTGLLAWFGGSALFFITLIFPVQFEKQWITLGWALEGTALLWLFRRVPHPGLRGLGVLLLGVAFVRLALNPAVLDYHARTGTPLFNWFLYAYGLTTICLLAGARLEAPPRPRVLGLNPQPVLYTLGTVLAFLLVNIEIADYFSTGTTLTFEFSGSFARDMTYSIAWGLFALGLLGVGVWKAQPAVRYSSLALLGVTVAKLFLHDLVRLSALYRIGAFLGVAIVSILASVLYQRFFAALAHPAAANSETLDTPAGDPVQTSESP
jgi:uncharacterized membrane protein